MMGMRDFAIDQMFARMDDGMTYEGALEDIMNIAQTGLQLVRTDNLKKNYKELIECAEELYSEMSMMSEADQEGYAEAMMNGFYRTRYTK